MKLANDAVKNLFDYKNLHWIDQGYYIFIDVTLKQDFGKFKTGTSYPEVHINGLQLIIIEDADSHMMPPMDHNFPLIFAAA